MESNSIESLNDVNNYLMIDIGANLTNRKFAKDLDSVVQRAKESGFQLLILVQKFLLLLLLLIFFVNTNRSQQNNSFGHFCPLIQRSLKAVATLSRFGSI
jgi:uncharacterized integral membrane protein